MLKCLVVSSEFWVQESRIYGILVQGDSEELDGCIDNEGKTGLVSWQVVVVRRSDNLSTPGP